MPRQVSTLTKYVIFIGLGLLFLPKINLVAVEGFRAGLRIDDFVIAIVVLYLCNIGYSAQIIRAPSFRWGVGFVMVSWISHVLGGGSVLFSLRMLEYLCLTIVGFAYGQIAVGRNWLAKLLYFYLGSNLLVSVLQALGLVGGIGLSGYTDVFYGRVIGLCNGPWELGIVVCFLYSYLGDDEWIRKVRVRRLVVFAGSGLIIVLTAARTPMAIFMLIMAVRGTEYLPKAARLWSRIAAPALAFIVLYAGVALVKSDNFAVERLREILNPESVGELRDYILNFSPSSAYVETSAEGLSKYSDARVDASMAIRLHIFSYMFGSYCLGGPFVWFFGLGHGFSGPSTDLGMVRIVCEVGMVGFTCFHMMLWSYASEIKGARMMVIALLVNQLTLDVYVGYKTMFVFFVIMGYGTSLAMNERRLHGGQGLIHLHGKMTP